MKTTGSLIHVYQTKFGANRVGIECMCLLQIPFAFVCLCVYLMAENQKFKMKGHTKGGGRAVICASAHVVSLSEKGCHFVYLGHFRS